MFSKIIIKNGTIKTNKNIEVFTKYKINKINAENINFFLFSEIKDKNNNGKKIAIKLSS